MPLCPAGRIPTRLSADAAANELRKGLHVDCSVDLMTNDFLKAFASKLCLDIAVANGMAFSKCKTLILCSRDWRPQGKDLHGRRERLEE